MIIALFVSAFAAEWSSHIPSCHHGSCEEVSGPVQPMCDAAGVCGEVPTEATPRTQYTSISHWSGSWVRQFDINKAHARAFVPNGKPPLVLLGDSIFESFLGTSGGAPHPDRADVPAVFEAKYGARFNALPLAISGDQTQHLLWRMPFEIPDWTRRRHDAIFLVLIGTNNIGNGHLPIPTAHGIESVVAWLINNTRGSVVVCGLLPRNDTQRLAKICPPRCNRRGEPFASFLPAIVMANSALWECAHAAGCALNDARVDFVTACGLPFLNHATVHRRRGSARRLPADDFADSPLNSSLMPDSLHPNARGHAILADCLFAHSNKLLHSHE